MNFLLFLSITLNVFQYFLHKRRIANHSAVRIVFKNGMGKRIKKMNLKANDTLPITIQAEDKFGNPVAALDAPPAWSIADQTLATVSAADDGMSAVVTPTGKEGTTQVQVLGSAGGVQIAGSLDLTVIAGDAASFVLQPGTPVSEDAPAAKA